MSNIGCINVLDLDWYCYRYEFSVLRRAIHCHGLAKLKTDHGRSKLGEIAYKGYLAQQTIKGYNVTEQCDLSEVIDAGKQAEEEICAYYDYLASCCNPVNENLWDLHPCRKQFSML